MLIGHIEEIVRHPVKSFRGESVQATNVMEYGLYGDRSHTFRDDTRNDKYLTITQFPEMVRYAAKFAGVESTQEYPKVEITTPEGKVLEWGDPALLSELEEKSKRKVSFLSYTPENVPLGAIEEEHVQLVTDASLDKLHELWGESVDQRRFRPNLVLSLKDKIPFIEESWFGKQIKIGSEVVLRLNRHCERCMIITVDPDSSEKAPSLLKTVYKERKNNFGIYASVIKTGKIHVGDEIYLVD
ncbi:MOSC domain-containing protein [Bacillus sp. Au-Bac7]|uniref:MOSC domain-containing protein n=1 Tax=Bacillus sp. Au-Bac7 TaxID=2906458 RepID=UPI001E487CB1|nr:MOSC domain-containing protein [Bacillus sp. Au-Bac7]MCE4050329.1 MOSC domain-containing protein [Bacillus sp. Au-Bac7]